jgi:glutamine amidotransferase
MHNGVISNFSKIRRDMASLICFDAYCNVLGSTDSEHAAALYMTNLTNHGDKSTWDKPYPLKAMFAALRKTVIQILTLQHKILGNENTPNSLNFCTTDGTKLLAIRFRNHATQQPPSLYWSEFAGRTLNTKYPGHPDKDGVNEQSMYDESRKEWHLIGANHALLVDEDGVEREVEIEYDGDLNARDPKFDARILTFDPESGMYV